MNNVESLAVYKIKLIKRDTLRGGIGSAGEE